MGSRKEKSFEGILIRGKETVLVDARMKHPFVYSLIQLFLIEAVLYSVVFSFVTGFYLEVEPGKLYAAVFFLSLLFWGVFLMQKISIAVLLPLFATYIYAGYRLWHEIENGFWHIENSFIQYMNKYYGIKTSGFLVDDYEPAKVITLFMIFAAFLLAIIISLVIMDKAAIFLYYLITLPLIVLPFLVGLIPATAPFAVYIASTFGMFVLGSRMRRKSLKALDRENRKQLEKSRYKIGLRSSFLMFLGILSLFIIISLFYTQKDYDKNPNIVKVKKNFVVKVQTFDFKDLAPYFDFLNNGKVIIFEYSSGNGGLNEGKLGRVGKLSYDNKTDIIIDALENSKTIYLKGFTGSIYDGDSWNGLSEESLAEFQKYEDLWEAIGLEVGDQTGGFLSSLTNIEGYLGILGYYNRTMDIQNLDADSKYFYAPYYTRYSRNTGLDLKDPEYVKNRTASKNYSVDYYMNFSDESLLDKNFYSDFMTYQMNLYTTLSNVTLANHLSDELDSYMETEKQYGAFIKKVFTQVPEKGLERLKTDMAGKYDEMKSRYGEAEALGALTSYIRSYIQKDTVYSLNPGTLPRGEDFVEYFLYEKKKGFCTHYASAATMAFRIAGVPARYVEGYVAKPDTIRKGKIIGTDKVVDPAGKDLMIEKDVAVREVRISDSGAHAWVEVYKDGWGWVPVEMTPGFQTETDNNQTEAVQTTPSVTPVPSISSTPTPTPDNNTEGRKDVPSGSKAGDKKERKAADIILFSLGAVFFTVLAFLLAGVLFKIYRNILYQKAAPGRRIILTYRKVKRLFRKVHLSLEEDDYEQLAWKSEEVLPQLKKEKFTEFIDIVSKARFGYAPMTAEELRTVRKYYHRVRKGVFGGITPVMRIVYNLYLL